MAAAPTLLGRCLAVAYGKAVATAKLFSSRQAPSSQGAQHPPHLAPRGSSFPAPFLSGSSCACSISHSHAHPPYSPTSPAPILSLTTFDAGSDYFLQTCKASHKTQTPGTSLVGLTELTFNAGDMDSIPELGTNIPHARGTSKPTHALGNEDPTCPN